MKHLNVPTRCNSTMPIDISILNIEEHPWHLHPDTLEIIYVLNGTIELHRSIYTSTLKSGDISVVNPDIMHHIYSVEDNIIMLFHFDVKYFESYFENLYDMIFVCDSASSEGQTKYFTALRKQLISIYYSYIRESDDNDDSLFSNCISCISVLVNHFCEWQQNDAGITTSNPYKKKPIQLDRLMRIINYMYANSSHKISLDDIARSEFVSKYHISHLFSQGLGMNFQSYLNIIRVESAQEYLYGTDLPISTISEKCGFSSPGFFRKTYEHYMGISPLADRKKASTHTIDYTTILDTDLSGTLTDDYITMLLGVYPDRIRNHHSLNDPDPLQESTVDILSAETLNTSLPILCAHIGSAADLLASRTIAAIRKLHQFECCDTISVSCALISEAYMYFHSWDFLLPLISALKDADMNLLIFECTESDIAAGELADFCERSSYCRLERSSAKTALFSSDMPISEYVDHSIVNRNDFNALPLFTDSEDFCGLFYKDNTKTRWFYAFFIMNRIKGDVLKKTSDYIITRKNDSLSIILLNDAAPDSPYQQKSVIFRLANLRRDYTCCIYNFPNNADSEVSICRSLNLKSSLPDNLSALIERKAFPDFDIFEIDSTPEYNLYAAASKGSVTLIELL